MKYCSNCGNSNDDANKFCGDCGQVFVHKEKLNKDDNIKTKKKFNKKIKVAAAVVVVLMLSFFIVKYNHVKSVNNEQIADGQEFLKDVNINSLESSLNTYENKDTGFLKEYLEHDVGFNGFEKELDSIISSSSRFTDTKDNELNKQTKSFIKEAKTLKNRIDRIREKIEIQQRVNYLYPNMDGFNKNNQEYKITAAIHGDKVSYNLSIRDEIKEEDIKSAKEGYVEEKDGKKLSQWQKAINKLIINAETQYGAAHGKANTGGTESDRSANAGENAGKVSSSISKLTNEFAGEWVVKDSSGGRVPREFSYTKDSRHIKFNDDVEEIDVSIVSAEKNAEGNVVIKVYDPNYGTDYKTLTFKYKDNNTMLFMNDSAYDPLGEGFRTFIRK
ncbi:zinc ribbon domain-containing protein [Bacillus cereus]|uniref:zinc ribbon domain-containing protein n=1 Tax=Bacillus cereus TaxID=1396 RepID=UPI000BF6B1F0|nr:zinc ribbon domain-containing protein [Bacillus cereus]PEX83255.1 hypothetical protein CN450_20705 [Bacillus cereus]